MRGGYRNLLPVSHKRGKGDSLHLLVQTAKGKNQEEKEQVPFSFKRKKRVNKQSSDTELKGKKELGGKGEGKTVFP